jgi:putative ABC transport system permease protein
MNKWRIIKSVRRLLFLNKLRLLLTLAGVAIGIACEMVIVAAASGAREVMLSQIKSMGSNLITVSAGSFKEVFGRKMQTANVTTLKKNDADAIYEGCSFVSLVAPVQQRMALATYKDSTTSTTNIGTTPEYPAVRNFEALSGRFFNSEENKLSLRVAVIGQKVARSLFRNIDPIGKIIQIETIPFEVVGTMKPKGMSYDGVDEDDVIFIPLNTALRRVFNINYIGYIYVKASEKEKMGVVETEIRNVLRERHRLNALGKKDDFTIQNIYTTLQVARETNASFSNLIAAVALISLLVGGVGILAVMLLSVKERRSEIGLRMAVGAEPGDILLQFFLEATTLSAAGGITGICVGLLSIYLLKVFASLTATVSFELVVFSVIVSIIIGIVFGALPARKASLIEPVRALRD